MTDMEIMIADLILACQQQNVYRYGKYQMLHGLKYQKDMAEEAQEKIRRLRIIGDRILCRRLEKKMFDISAMCQIINDFFQEMKREGHDPFFNRWKM